MTLEDIVKNAFGGVFNNTTQAWNHSFNWKCMSSKLGSMPTRVLSDSIKIHFGSFQNFKEAFTNAAVILIGSGWAWLVKEDGGRRQT